MIAHEHTWDAACRISRVLWAAWLLSSSLSSVVSSPACSPAAPCTREAISYGLLASSVSLAEIPPAGEQVTDGSKESGHPVVHTGAVRCSRGRSAGTETALHRPLACPSCRRHPHPLPANLVTKHAAECMGSTHLVALGCLGALCLPPGLTLACPARGLKAPLQPCVPSELVQLLGGGALRSLALGSLHSSICRSFGSCAAQQMTVDWCTSTRAADCWKRCAGVLMVGG